MMFATGNPGNRRGPEMYDNDCHRRRARRPLARAPGLTVTSVTSPSCRRPGPRAALQARRRALPGVISNFLNLILFRFIVHFN